jgi:uncharacterized membrane protein YgdD (TMEM256/DUF423 family)
MTQAAVASAMLALAVVLGAFGAHGLRDILDPYSMTVYEKGVFYHFVHALGMLAIPVLVQTGLAAEGPARWASRMLFTGVVFFSGSLYVLAISGQTLWGAVAPIGGTAFIVGWMALAWATLKNDRQA